MKKLHDIKDINLKDSGLKKIAWVKPRMPVLSTILKVFQKTQPLSGKRIAMSIHLEAKTAYLALVLKAAGAEVWATGCNTLSTQDDIAAALVSKGINVFAIHGVDQETYVKHLQQTLSCKPHLIIDDGGDLVDQLINKVPECGINLIGGCEETTTGIHRLKALEETGALPFPMMSVNDAECKHLFDNIYGTGQSTWTAIMKATNSLVAGKTVVVAGYGDCGHGVAKRAAGMGAHVIITEINPVKALEAIHDGYKVMTMDEAAPQGDIFVTVTGNIDVIVDRHFRAMKNNVILANAGHFDVEINLKDLAKIAVEYRPDVRDDIDSYILDDGKVVNVLAKGKLVNLASSAGDGHPAEIMDMSFSVQALGLMHLVNMERRLENQVYPIPEEINNYIAETKLATLGAKIDKLTPAQKAYLNL